MNRETKIYEPSKILHYEAKTKELLVEAIELKICPEHRPEETQTLTQNQITLGATKECDVRIDDPYISKQHALICKENNIFWLKDLESRNGTWVKNQKIKSVSLSDRGVFQIGTTKIQYQFSIATEKIRPHAQTQLGEMLGKSRAMKEVFALIQRVAPTDVNVCLIGESGTGKELAAQNIHRLSCAAKGPFVAMNCGAVPANLIESELFGHERGAFTGAQERRIGVFEQAQGGTLLLDEIGEMPIDLQTRLLRILENRVFRRVGGNADIPVNVRVITATHRDLATLVQKGAFREDLFYRLYVVPIFIAPLRDRPDDIELLAEYFLRKFDQSPLPKQWSGAALEKLLKHPWHGNVRELKNTIQRVVLFCDNSTINIDLLEKILPAPTERANKESLNFKEKEVILATLKLCKNNFSKTARKLGIARTTLHSKMKRYGLEREDL